MKKSLFLLIASLLHISCNDSADGIIPVPDPDLVYFLVKEIDPIHGDSYILPLKEASHIAEARQLILNQEKKIIVAEITKSKEENYSMNKDLINNREWSWHVSEFLLFADNTIEILDGWPQYVEEHYAEWVNTTKGVDGNGRIGFWNYTIVREVTKEELYD